MTTRAQTPVGVFDSGLGGLSVLRAIRAELPAESLLYLADSRHAPYGEKSPEYIADRTLRACEWLVEQGCKALVIACNTATAQAVHVLRHGSLAQQGSHHGLQREHITGAHEAR